MPSLSTPVDYEPDVRPDKIARPSAGAGARPEARLRTSPAPIAVPVRPADFGAVEEFLQLLARAVRQFHTYPATSPLCTDAISACHKVLASLEGRDRLACRVTPRELIVDDIGIGGGTIVEHEVVRRLHRAHVAALDIDRIASPRDLSRFSTDVLRCDDLAKTKTTLAELLAEHGVETIAPHLAQRPEMLEVGAPQASRSDLVARERRRHALIAAAGPASYLYPPDKGWVRLDPSAIFDTISLMDLAILVDDPGDIASMLLRLTDDDAAVESREGALQQKFSDVATLLAALDPPLARVMFSKLARAVLDLGPERRTDLLKRKILPGLLDGGADGAVLRDFPNVDLAESLCLLMDLETAAPELLTTALDRLDLPADRRQEVAPLLEARLRDGNPAATPDARQPEAGIDRYVSRLIRVTSAGKSFSDFAAFDLSIDEQTTAALGAIQESIANTDMPVAQLHFLLNLVRLEPNPALAGAFLRRSMTALGALEHAARQQDVAVWAAQYARLAETLRPSRPDVADAISNALAAFCTPDRTVVLADLYAMDAGARAIANQLVEAFGAALAPACVALVDDHDMRSRARTLVPLMCEHGRLLAPALAARLGHCGAAAARVIIKVLGFAGPGYETVLAEQLQLGDELTAREALQALAHIGSTKAASIVGVHLRRGASSVRAAAEEALRHFPPAAVAAALRDLIGNRDFILQHPQIAVRLLDRAEQVGLTDLQPAMRALVPLRFRFWNPAVVRVARKARTMMGPR
jgi:hypothetical protein